MNHKIILVSQVNKLRSEFSYIDKLTERKKTAQAEYRSLSKDFRDQEQQLQMMTDYMDREGIKVSKTRSKTASKYPSHDR